MIKEITAYEYNGILFKTEYDAEIAEWKLSSRNGSNELSKREEEVFNLVIAGYTNDEIKESLDISLSTVKKHVTSILIKNGVSDRMKLVVNYYTQQGK